MFSLEFYRCLLFPDSPNSLCSHHKEIWHPALTSSLLWDRDSPADTGADTAADQEPEDLFHCRSFQGPT